MLKLSSRSVYVLECGVPEIEYRLNTDRNPIIRFHLKQISINRMRIRQLRFCVLKFDIDYLFLVIL